MTKHGKNIFDSDFESIVIGTFSHRNLVISYKWYRRNTRRSEPCVIEPGGIGTRGASEHWVIEPVGKEHGGH